MSAIGNYIYYTALWYLKGDPRLGKREGWNKDLLSDIPSDRNFIKLRQSRAVFEQTKSNIRNAFMGKGDRQLAISYAAVLNIYTGKQSVGHKNLVAETKTKIEKILKNKFDGALNQVNLDKMTLKYSHYDSNIVKTDNQGGLIEMMNVKDEIKILLREAKNKTITKEKFTKALEALDNLISDEGYRRQIQQAIMNTDRAAQILDQRIAALKKALQVLNAQKVEDLYQYADKEESGYSLTQLKNAWNTINNMFASGTSEGFHTAQASGSSIMQEVRTLLNYLVLPNSALIGAVTEEATLATVIANESIGKYTVLKELSKVVGNENSRAAAKADSLVYVENPDDLMKNFGYKYEEIDGTGFYVEASPRQNKVDVTIMLEDPNTKEKKVMDISVKHAGGSDVLTFVSNGSLWNMIAQENYNDFVNHYINITAPKANYNETYSWNTFNNTNERKNAVSLVSKYYGAAESTMNQLVKAKAVAGYNLTRSTDGKIQQMKMPNYLNIYSTTYGGWLTYTMNDIYNYFIGADTYENGKNQGFIIVGSGGKNSKHTVNPFLGMQAPMAAPVHDEAVIKRRIAGLLYTLHQRKITVYTTIPRLRAALAGIYES